MFFLDLFAGAIMAKGDFSKVKFKEAMMSKVCNACFSSLIAAETLFPVPYSCWS